MVPEMAARASLSVVQGVARENDAVAERSRQRQRRNAETSRMDVRHARISFIILFTGLSAWLGLQLVLPPLWP